MPEQDLTMYEDETTITYISLPIYQVHKVDPVLFCVDTGATYSCIRDKALEKIVRHSGRRYISIIDSKRDFKLSDILVRSKGMVELMLPTSESIIDLSVILDALNVEIQPLPRLDVLDRNNVLVRNVTNHLWNRIITNNDPFRFEDIWKIKLISKYDDLYVPLSSLIQLFCSMAQLRKLHEQFAHPSTTKLYDLLRTAGKKAIAPKTLDRLEYLVPACKPYQQIRTAPKR